MAFSVKSQKTGKEYFLHSKLAKNGTTRLYFFAGDQRDDAVDALPEGYVVSELAATGLPVLKKAQG